MSCITNIRTTSPVNTFVGPGSSQVAGKIIHDMCLTKVMVVCDATVKSLGLADSAIGSLEATGIEVIVFDGVLPDPTDVIVKEAADLYQENNCQAVVAIGGGSSIDTGKSVAMLQTFEGGIEDFLANPTVQLKKGAPLIAIPTTSGTGSEVTYAAVVTSSKTGAKVGFGSEVLYPTAALLDPLLTVGLPKGGTAMTAMDAFAHSVESMLSVISNPICDLLSLEAIRLIMENLEKALANGSDIEARQNLMLAAYYGGLSLNDGGCQFGHAIAHTIGAKYRLPHGALCAISVPMTIELMASRFPEKICKIGKVLGVALTEDMSAEEIGKCVADAVRAFNNKLGMKSFKELGVVYEELPEIAEAATTDAAAFALKLIMPEFGANDFLVELQKEYQR